MRKPIAILGSTGSIGTQALEVIACYPQRFRVAALAAGKNIELLLEQAERFRPPIISVAHEDDVERLRAALPYEAIVEHGTRGLASVACESGAQLLLAATDGSVALPAVLAAAAGGIDIAVANKEIVVAAGELLMAAAARSGARVLPVDSEHSALFQCLQGERHESIAALVLTASGGPFRSHSPEQLAHASVAEALLHPTWRMGRKNTIDSATLMNKGLEVIEASRLFGLGPDQIRVVVHPQSIIHGMVVFRDGNVKAQLGLPDMRLPIGYALAYPERLPGHPLPTLDPLALLGAKGDAAELRFEPPDLARFPCLRLAFEALRLGGAAPAMLSAANEIAVHAFLEGGIAFTEIARVIEAAMAAQIPAASSLEAIQAAEAGARQRAAASVGALGSVPN